MTQRLNFMPPNEILKLILDIESVIGKLKIVIWLSAYVQVDKSSPTNLLKIKKNEAFTRLVIAPIG